MNGQPPLGGIRPPKFLSIRSLPNAVSPLSTSTEQWISVISAECHFPLSVFLSTIKSLSLHPERNSALILRADPLPPAENSKSDQAATSELGLDLVEELRVRLLPRQPKRDFKVDQTILFYRSAEDGHKYIDKKGKGKENQGEIEVDIDQKEKKEFGLVITIPEVKNESEIPYYHPKLRKLAYYYESVSPQETNHDKGQAEDGVVGENSETAEEAEVKGIISIHYLSFTQQNASEIIINTPEPVSTDDKLSPSTSTSSQNILPPRPTKPRRRSPLAGPSIEVDETRAEPIKPPAVILSEEASPFSVSNGNGTTSPEGAERLYRISLALLETLHKHGYGQLVGYQKRRIHDVIVARDNFQDLYLVLKDRHRQLDSRAPKAAGLSSKLEDVKRHVWKSGSSHSTPNDSSLPIHIDLSEWGEQDIAIAAFLMLLWKDIYPPRTKSEAKSNGVEVDEEHEWDTWGRPEGGFIDLGCGNGLLVHILTSEGYYGKGYELRSRKTWPLYPAKTQEALVELSIDPPSWFPDTIEEWESGSWPGKEGCIIKENTFLIGNHADELTPWLPLLSLLPSKPVPHLSLPCCFHTLDGAFSMLQFTAPDHPHTPQGGFENGLEPGVSRYQSYLVWLGWYGLMCGWEWEKEGLRVPSTKGWGIVARKRWTTAQEDKECREWALEQVNEVKGKGDFKIRVREGKDH